MEFTFHAAKQAQRRGVDADWVACVLEYGEEYKGGGGCLLFRISTKERLFLKSENPSAWKQGRDKHRVAVVLAGDAVVTVMHRRKRLRKMKHFGSLN